MKKVVFGFQVFILIGLGPLYVFLEMNHGKKVLNRDNSHSDVTNKIVRQAIRPPDSSTVQNGDAIFSITQKMPLLYPGF